MITRDELEKYKKIKGLDMGQTEKDYFLELALMIISRETKNELIFKGGTCMYKFYGLNRFSEDLDFSATEKFQKATLFDKLIRGLRDFGVIGTIKNILEPYNSILTTMHLQGPLYDGRSMTKSTIRIDINIKSEVLLPVAVETLYSGYREILPFQVLCMNKNEITAEKIRAIMTRDKARDVYDLWFLMKNGVALDLALIEKKMSYYNMIFDKGFFAEKLSEKEVEWDEELSHFVFGPIPKFVVVKDEIVKWFGAAYNAPIK